MTLREASELWLAAQAKNGANDADARALSGYTVRFRQRADVLAPSEDNSKESAAARSSSLDQILRLLRPFDKAR